MSATIADTIYQALSERIVSGRLQAGEKLRQDHIARDFDTSHVPVREALLRLAADGLLIATPRKGMTVRGISFSLHQGRLHITVPVGYALVFKGRFQFFFIAAQKL